MTTTARPATRRRTEGRTTRLAATALRLLLDDPLLDRDAVDWIELTRLAERAGVVVRLADAVHAWEEYLPNSLAESAARACARTQQAVALVDQLTDACTRLGVSHAFLKTAERYPDTGPDIDLLVSGASPALDAAILSRLPAIACRRPLRHRLNGSRTYRAAFGIVIDVHHGRLGVAGEQARFARLLLSRARPVPLGETSCRAPTPEDTLLLIAAQQAYMRHPLHIANVYTAITTLRRQNPLNWDYLFATALSMGTLPAVDAYLSYIERLHSHLLKKPLIAGEILSRFRVRKRTAEAEEAQFPSAGPSARLYLDHLYAAMEAGRWHSMARLLLLPVMAALAAKSRRVP